LFLSRLLKIFPLRILKVSPSHSTLFGIILNKSNIFGQNYISFIKVLLEQAPRSSRVLPCLGNSVEQLIAENYLSPIDLLSSLFDLWLLIPSCYLNTLIKFWHELKNLYSAQY
jgi:hypothetical protein